MDDSRIAKLAVGSRPVRHVAGVRLACTALVMSSALLAVHPPRRTALPELSRAVEWAAKPAIPAIDPPVVSSRPAEDVLTLVPLIADTHRDSEVAPTITRRTTRTRLGGRFGP